MKMLEDLEEVVRLITEYESHTRDDNGCSDHPMAPHGFNRNESHNQDRYVCDCEGWQPDAASELAIARALVLYVRTHHTTIRDMAAMLEAAEMEVARMDAIINTPQSDDFLRAVSIEAEHQRKRWGSEHDSGKSPADWFWLIGYLGGKALHAHAAGNVNKAEHHVITTAAACANWHQAMLGNTDMCPGIDGDAAMQETGR